MCFRLPATISAILVAFFVLAVPAYAVPTVTEIACNIHYINADGTEGRGALYERECTVIFQWGQQRRLFSCTLNEGDPSCSIDQESLDHINSYFQTLGNPDAIDTAIGWNMTTMVEVKNGCSGTAGIVTITPTNGSGSCLETANTCQISMYTRYECAKFPDPTPSPTPTPTPTATPTLIPSPSPTPMPTPTPEDPGEFRQCRADYLGCLNENIRLQLALGACRGIPAVVVSLSDFSGGIQECREHLGACHMANYQLGHALGGCQ